MKYFFTNEHTGKRYEIVEMDAEAGKVVLRGETATFEEEYSKEKFKRLGYKLEKVEDEDA